VIASKPHYGVVDQNLKVFGIKNLWICDASVIPSPITINIALTVMALSRYAAVRIAAS
jgi:cholesterol oxidase